MDVRGWVFKARQHAGLSQSELGEPLGVTKANVSSWEKGRHEPSFRQLLKIEDVTGFRLFTSEGKPTGALIGETAPHLDSASVAIAHASEWATLMDIRRIVDRRMRVLGASGPQGTNGHSTPDPGAAPDPGEDGALRAVKNRTARTRPEPRSVRSTKPSGPAKKRT